MTGISKIEEIQEIHNEGTSSKVSADPNPISANEEGK